MAELHQLTKSPDGKILYDHHYKVLHTEFDTLQSQDKAKDDIKKNYSSNESDRVFDQPDSDEIDIELRKGVNIWLFNTTLNLHH